MIYQDPRTYLLGLEGLALLDAWAGDHDQAFVEDRLEEIRKLIDDPKLADRAVKAEVVSAATAYEQEAAGYDEKAGGGLFGLDQPVILEMLRGRPAGSALDAACGTGRLAELLVNLGHRVVGVDVSSDMLGQARQRVPQAEFHLGRLDHLPLPDDSVDIVTCGLALVHVSNLDPVMAEFARILRPGGDLVISDIHHELVNRGSVIKARGPSGEPYVAVTYRHRLGHYLRSALRNGFGVRQCEEPGMRSGVETPPEPTGEIGGWDIWPWSLMSYMPSAAMAAGAYPLLVIWHFQLAGA